jgi:hypothetical protein
MPDLTHGSSRAQKTIEGVSVRVSEHLDGSVALEGQRASPIDHSHPASTNPTDDFVLGVDYFARGELSVVCIEAGVLFDLGHCPQSPLFSVIDTMQKLANCRMELRGEMALRLPRRCSLPLPIVARGSQWFRLNVDSGRKSDGGRY